VSGPAPGDDLFQFPCDFPIKVMGRDTPEFRSVTLAIIEKHAPALRAGDVSERPSRQGNFIGLTYTVRAESRAQLDAIYQELTASDVVLVAL
jgi:putative lipoic acid-binding regulatory protein